LLAEPLKVDECLLHYLIVWILCPQGTNHKDEMSQYDNEKENPLTDHVPPIDTNIGSSSGVNGSSSSLEESILSMSRRLKEFFLLSSAYHEEVIGLIRGLDCRVLNLEKKFHKEFTHDDDDDMSTEF